MHARASADNQCLNVEAELLDISQCLRPMIFEGIFPVLGHFFTEKRTNQRFKTLLINYLIFFNKWGG